MQASYMRVSQLQQGVTMTSKRFFWAKIYHEHYFGDNNFIFDNTTDIIQTSSTKVDEKYLSDKRKRILSSFHDELVRLISPRDGLMELLLQKGVISYYTKEHLHVCSNESLYMHRKFFFNIFLVAWCQSDIISRNGQSHDYALSNYLKVQ